jgi:hypothetical protein
MFIGIDPGKTGGIVGVTYQGHIAFKYATPVIGKEIDWGMFAEILREPDTDDRARIFIEHVHAMHNVAAGTTFTFGGCFEGAKALCAAFRLPYTLVAPKKWQAVMWSGVPEHRKPPKKLTKKELAAKALGEKVRKPKAIGAIDTKVMSLIAATRLFPGDNFLPTTSKANRKAHDGIVDALLISEYGRRLILNG